MWVALCTAFFAPFPIVVFLLSAVSSGKALRARKWTGAVPGIMIMGLVFRLRYIVRILRRAGKDNPRRVIPDVTGVVNSRSGVTLRYNAYGSPEKPMLLLAHGWSLTQDSWYYQINAFRHDYFVVTWDMRGNGQSGVAENGDYSCEVLLDDFADVFQEVVRKFGPTDIVMAGHSLGGMLLPLFASAYPSLMIAVRGMALLSATDRPLLRTMSGRRWLVPLQSVLLEPIARLAIRYPRVFGLLSRTLWQIGSVHMALMFGLHVGRESREQNDFVAYLCSHFDMTAAGAGAITAFNFDAQKELEQLDLPVLLLTGECDRNMPADIQIDMANRLRHSELVIVPNCGHVCIIECHEDVNVSLKSFANRCVESASLASHLF